MRLEQFNYRYKSDKERFGFFEVWDNPELQSDGFFMEIVKIIASS